MKIPLSASVAAIAVVMTSMAAQAADLADMFGARDSVQQISLSPDGTKVAYIAPRGDRGESVYVADLTGGNMPTSVATLDGNPQRFLDCNWVANNRLACRVYGVVQAADLVPVTRTIAIDTDGKNFKMLTAADDLNLQYGNTWGGNILDLNPGQDGSVLMDRWFVPESGSSGPTRLGKTLEGFGVVQIDTRTLATKVVQQPDRDAEEYLTDGHGNIRVMGIQAGLGTDVAGDVVRYSYRGTSGGWRSLGELNVVSNEGLRPLAVDASLNSLYALRKVNGREALYRVNLDGSLKQDLVMSRPDVDIDDVIRIGRSQRPVGATFATDKRQSVYFDPQLKQLGEALGRSLPGLPLIEFVDSSSDESHLLLRASSDVDPGRLYVFDKGKHSLNEIMLVRPQLEGVALARVQSISYKTADGVDVPAYLTMPPSGAQKGIPAIVMPHGGPSARDEWGFDWLAQYYAASGYAVIQPNYRGSTGYGDDWYEKNGFQSWTTAIHDVTDAGHWLVSQGIADPKKLAIVGWSYGGYAALQSAVTDPSLFKAVVAIAPVTDLEMLKEEFRGWTTHALSAKFIGQGDNVRKGSPAENVKAIVAPVMLFHGTHDRNVDVKQSQRMASRLLSAGKQVELITYPDLDHSLPDSRVRADMLRRSDQFLRAAFTK